MKNKLFFKYLFFLVLIASLAANDILAASDIVVTKAGQLAEVYKDGKVHNVYKLDGTVDERENDLEELSKDWLFYRDRVLSYSQAGETKKADKARQSFYEVTRWLRAYHNDDVFFMVDKVEKKRHGKIK